MQWSSVDEEMGAPVGVPVDLLPRRGCLFPVSRVDCGPDSDRSRKGARRGGGRAPDDAGGAATEQGIADGIAANRRVGILDALVLGFDSVRAVVVGAASGALREGVRRGDREKGEGE